MVWSCERFLDEPTFKSKLPHGKSLFKRRRTEGFDHKINEKMFIIKHLLCQ